MTETKKVKVVTHDGSFHTDDLFAVATLRLVYDIDVIRTRDESVIESGDIVLDVGGVYDHNIKRYDHHQKEGAGQRVNGIPYASFGLIWKHYGLALCEGEESVWKTVDERLVSFIDSVDNGISPYTETKHDSIPYSVEDAFMTFSPNWNEDDVDNNAVFVDLSEKVAAYLKRKISSLLLDKAGEKILEEAYASSATKSVVEIPGSLPRYLYQNFFSKTPDVLYVVYPSSDHKSFKAEAIRKDETTMTSRKPFPLAWHGVLGDNGELEKITGVEGAHFCHRNGFLVTASSKDAILKLVDMALA